MIGAQMKRPSPRRLPRSTDLPHSLELKSMDIRPLHDRIIVRRLEEGEQKVGGIIIPDTAKEKPQQGKVIATGNGKVKDDGKRVPLDVKAGDLILFGKYTSQEVKLDGEEYLILREDEVLAVSSKVTSKSASTSSPERSRSRCAGSRPTPATRARLSCSA